MPHATWSSTPIPSPTWSSGGCWDRPAGRCRCARSIYGSAASSATCGDGTTTAPRWGWAACIAKSRRPSGSSTPRSSMRRGTRARPWTRSSSSSGPKGSVMSCTFQLEGQDFYALNGGPQFKFTPAISLFVNCETQQEVDELWKKLSAGGREDQCGWLQDKYGLSWQIIPTALGRMLGDKDPEKANRVMRAMLQMKKIDIKGLQQAYDRG